VRSSFPTRVLHAATPPPSRCSTEHRTPAADRAQRPLLSDHELDLDVEIIAHDRTAQALMDTNDIVWGVQFEIARGVLNGWWRWENVTADRVHCLHGSHAQATPLVKFIMRGCEILTATTLEEASSPHTRNMW